MHNKYRYSRGTDTQGAPILLYTVIKVAFVFLKKSLQSSYVCSAQTTRRYWASQAAHPLLGADVTLCLQNSSNLFKDVADDEDEPEGYGSAADREYMTQLTTWGGLLRNHLGEWIIGFSKAIEICSIPDAELQGIYEGLRIARDKNWKKVIVEMDCMDVLEVLKQKPGIRGISSLSPHVAALVYCSWNVVFRHTSRECNRVADDMSKLTLSLPFGFRSYLTPPTAVVGFLCDDSSTIQPMQAVGFILC
ncbi:hypothetical protein F3Y22_tig00013680pilonHSYRG00102 [Hibiscus syriacus]|uniref:RNase H type-1 domain-containing protein n=1 Tax=Hibiscus syriacus TaxID=106335 RepID=A0A6A3C114_HIBSY|nr:hypothetical protein F3Y22_tig00013680pilonHSYRG00102 [Hibiscus syriacus]